MMVSSAQQSALESVDETSLYKMDTHDSTVGVFESSEVIDFQEDDFTTASIHYNFVTTAQEMDSVYHIFDVITQWVGHIEKYCVEIGRNRHSEFPDTVIRRMKTVLRFEMETWDLIQRMYTQRVQKNQDQQAFPDDNVNVFKDQFHTNEAVNVQHIIEKDKDIAEIKIILNWLEHTYSKKIAPPDVLEKVVHWENTLDQLLRDKHAGKRTNKSMVSSIDPDALARERKQLHPFDAEEDMRVHKGAFYYLRAGNFDRLKTYLKATGNFMLAAAYNGCKYTEVLYEGGRSKLSGNLRRDLHKKISWMTCEDKELPKFHRATVGALCGHRAAMLEVANNWEDRLWSVLKSSMDVQIEQRLRKLNSNPAAYEENLPLEYYSQAASILDCFDMIEEDDDFVYSPEYMFRVVQKAVMANDVDLAQDILLRDLDHFLESSGEHPIIIGQVVRFIVHLLITLDYINIGINEQLMNLCSEFYIKILVESKLLIYIPYYVQRLSETRQVKAVVDCVDTSKPMNEDTIDDVVKSAAKNGLDVLGIGIAVVDKLLLEQKEFYLYNLKWITACDRLADPTSVLVTFLRYAVILMRKYLTLEMHDKAHELSKEIQDCSSIPEEYQTTLVAEFACYKAYLEAHSALRKWQKALSQKPVNDYETLLPSATPHDRNVWETKQREFAALKEKWSRVADHHFNVAYEKFLYIIKFPGGWLKNCCDPDSVEDLHLIATVRRVIISKVAFILLNLVRERKSVKLWKNLLYVVMEDEYMIYTELTRDELGAFSSASQSIIQASSEHLISLPK